MGAIIALLATLGVGAATVALGYSIFSNIKPGKGRIQKDLAEFRKLLQPLMVDLVPMEEGEIELLSSAANVTASKKRVTQTWQGNFTSIYQENMIAFGYRKYVSKSEDAILYAKTANHEYTYRVQGDVCEIAVDDKLLGNFKSDDILYLAKTKKAFAQMNRSGDSLIAVSINGKEVGSIYKKGVVQQPNPRAFELLSKMPKEHQLTFISLAIFELVKRHSLN
ncbi:MAG: hypothetical protein ACJAVF_001705 [Paraglaciecola sp.]|jgi:hypothetical protein